MKRWIVIAVEYDVGSSYQVTLGPVLVRYEEGYPDTLYWDFSEGYFPIGADHYRVLKVYGDWKGGDWDAADALELQYTRDFPPRQGLEDSPGWLSPSGVFYPCESLQHRYSSRALALLQDGEFSGNTERRLEVTGWVKVHSNMVCEPRKGEPTQAQIDVVFEMSKFDSKLGAGAKKTLSYWLEVR